MDRQFCPYCGNNTLNRVTASVDADGNLNIYLKRNYQYNIRGTRVSMTC
jgi:RNA-binding protein NOB1